mgnify:CR=1 FL=1
MVRYAQERYLDIELILDDESGLKIPKSAVVKKEFYVSRKHFIPEPNVDSVVVFFTEKDDKLPLEDFGFFERIVKESFKFKRKTLHKRLHLGQ